MKRSVKKNKSKIGIWAKIKNFLNNSPWHSAFTYPILFLTACMSLFFFSISLDLNTLAGLSLTLFFLTPLWVLFGLIVSKKRAPYLLSLIIGLGIPIIFSMIFYTDFTGSAKKNAIKTMHAQAVKYISAEIQKCKIGESKFMSNSQDCPATAAKAVIGAINSFADKNPYDTSQNAVREFNNNKDDKDVGFISLSASGSSVVIKSCISKPCYDEKNRLQDSIEIE